MNKHLTYLPVYIGLYLSQVLAVTCNIFLDIQYGSFATEVTTWMLFYGVSLLIGFWQVKTNGESGKTVTKAIWVIGALVTVAFIVPTWGFPRAGIYTLAVLQVIYNCYSTSRRQLYLSLLMSLVLVLFAASHYRADWSMLFYMVPYFVAVVFTLVAEQVNRKFDEIKQSALGGGLYGGQLFAIFTATLSVLFVAMLLYLVTPQVNWLDLSSSWGVPESASSSAGELSNTKVSGVVGKGKKSSGGRTGFGQLFKSLPTSDQLRMVAKREGMPEWQKLTINGMAGMIDRVKSEYGTVKVKVLRFVEQLEDWYERYRDVILPMLIWLAFLLLFYALYRLLREAKAGLWLRTRFDYVVLVHLGIANGDRATRHYYDAMCRLFSLEELERLESENTSRYQRRVSTHFRELSDDSSQITMAFEDVRYGNKPVVLQKLREAYKAIYQWFVQY